MAFGGAGDAVKGTLAGGGWLVVQADRATRHPAAAAATALLDALMPIRRTGGHAGSSGAGIVSEPGRGPGGRGLSEPGVLDDLGQLWHGELADPARADQHRRVTVEMRRGEERRRLVLDQGLLVSFRRYPEHDHVGVAFAGFGVEGVGARGA